MADYYFRNTGNVNWGTASNWSLTDGGGADGAVPTTADNAFFTTNSGNCTINTSNRVCANLDCTGYSGAFTFTTLNLQIHGTICVFSNTMSVVSTTSNTFVFNANMTITSNGLVINFPIAFGSSTTCTLGDDFYINNGIVRSSLAVINSNNFYLQDNSLFINDGTNVLTTGTSGVIITGDNTSIGASSGQNAGIYLSTTIDCGAGTCTLLHGTFSTTEKFYNYGGGTFKYLSGLVNMDWAFFRLGKGTVIFELNGLVIPGIRCVSGSVVLYPNGDVVVRDTIQLATSCTIHAGTGYFYTKNLIAASLLNISTGTIVFYDRGTWSGGGQIRCNIIFDNGCNTTLASNTIFSDSTMEVKRLATVSAKNVDFTVNSATLININRVVFKRVFIVGGGTLVMNEFFSGSANSQTRVASTTTSNYTINFTNGFEKISKFVRVSNCTIANKSQLLITTDKGNANTLGSFNIGIRYINHTPNGIARNNPSVVPQACFGIDDGFVNDPIIK